MVNFSSKREEQKNIKKKKTIHAAIRTCHHYKNGKSIRFSVFAYVERISRESVELLVLFVQCCSAECFERKYLFVDVTFSYKRKRRCVLQPKNRKEFLFIFNFVAIPVLNACIDSP